MWKMKARYNIVKKIPPEDYSSEGFDTSHKLS